MSAITISGDLVHYEDLGRGKPIILLHSWLGSWRYWIPTMQQLSVSKYRTYAIDLWGFGDSGKTNEEAAGTHYALENQVKLLHGFMEKMGIAKAVFVGHGLGASVIARYAADPERGKKVHRMAMIAPPLFDTGPAPAPKVPQALTANTAKTDGTLVGGPKPIASGNDPEEHDARTIPSMSREDRQKLLEQVALAAARKERAKDQSGEGKTPASSGKSSSPVMPPPLTDEQVKPPSRVEKAKSDKTEPVRPDAAKSGDSSEGEVLKKNPLMDILGDTDLQKLLSKHMDTSSSNFEKLKAEIAKTDPRAVPAVCQDVHTYRELMQIQIPTLVLMGGGDTLMKLSDDKLREQLRNRDQLAFIEFDGIRHYPMLEDTSKFTRLLRDFMESPDIDKLEVKDEWRRRTR